MDHWMDSMKAFGLPGTPSLHINEWLGDWLAPVPADDYLIFNAFHYRNAVLMEKFATLTENAEGQKKYHQIAEETKKEIGMIPLQIKRPVSQRMQMEPPVMYREALLLGLNCDVFADAVKEKAFAHLERTTRRRSIITIQSGFFGTGPINPMLSKGGYPEAAQRNNQPQTAFPSWLYPVTQGATTIWERWNSFTR